MTRSSARSNPAPNEIPPPLWETVVLVGLFQCRFFVPTEGAELGGTLWLAMAWFGFAALTLWLKSREKEPLLWTPHWSDLAIVLVVAGHLLSAVVLLRTGGNLRAALNMVWEWTSLLCLWGLFRTSLRDKLTGRTLTAGILTSVIVLSGFGIWQHYFWYPQQARELNELVTLQERMERSEPLSSHEISRFEELLQSFGASYSSLDTQGKLSFVARLRDSVEPIGRFALANSLAGLLCAGVLILAPLFVQKFSGWTLGQRLAGVGFLALIVLCLILTKSRTAWIATGFGLGLESLMFFRKSAAGRSESLRKTLTYSLTTGVLIVALLTLLAVWTGGLDPEVISEAPKSLQYRLEYWIATTQMLSDHFVLGIGPGNFRANYLHYKLPGASEEIIDPHNFLLDIWANGGLLALVGLIVWTMSIVFSGIMTSPPKSDTQSKSPDEAVPGMSVQWVCFGLLIITSLSFGGIVDNQLVALFISALIVVSVVNWLKMNDCLTAVTAICGLVALLLHLFASGGIEMPAIAQLLLFFGAVALSQSTSDQKAPITIGRTGQQILAASMGILLVGSLLTGVLPAQLAGARLTLGSESMFQGNSNYSAKLFARHEFLGAAAADTLDPEPYQLLAQLSYTSWKNSGRTDEDLFQEAVDFQNEAISRDPQNSTRYWWLGKFWTDRFRITQSQQDADEAVKAFENSVERYPHDAHRLAEFAIILEDTDRSGESVARQALELDDLNQTRGHVDKALSSEIRKRLEEIVSGAGTE
ncbi:MraY-like glycosyltransferase [Thalassoglobus neptunius]|uniref:MraY-like glycosyltransferase n=1 Tax=Thalassoglobus neptunius TaxID=1938619 RepID=A0A5C5WQ10_9PLAN|nr:O-antigen ligase family protein [Thalassoglobus neptunius]TWT52211.1 MraY-like glycosyltransferase [Thalassoglobus neptunius]